MTVYHAVCTLAWLAVAGLLAFAAHHTVRTVRARRTLREHALRRLRESSGPRRVVGPYDDVDWRAL